MQAIVPVSALPAPPCALPVGDQPIAFADRIAIA